MTWLWIWLQLWLQKRFRGKSGKLADYVGSFVLIKEFQGWPVVRHVATGALRMIVRHTGPRRVQDRGGWKGPVMTGVAFGVFYYFVYGPAISTLRGEALLQNSFFFGVFLALLSIPFWKLAQKTRLVIRFDDDVMSWRGPDRQRQRVRLEDIYKLQVLVPHRWADEEARKHANWRQSHGSQPGPKPLFQTSSELTLHTGPEGSHWHTVAEFRNDGSGEMSNRLMRAIDVVMRGAAGEQAEREKQAATAGPL
jgi:hypothetical protein